MKNIINNLRETVGDFLVELGCRISPVPEIDEIDSMIQHERLKALCIERVENPCPDCGGRGAKVTEAGDDVYVCETCQGTCINLAKMDQ